MSTTRGAIAPCPLPADDSVRVQPITSQPSWANSLAAAVPTYPQPAMRTEGISGSRGNLDFAELSWLNRAHLFQANQFEEREKRHYNLNPRRHLGEQLRELKRQSRADPVKNGFDFIGDGVVLAENLLQFFARIDSLDHVLKRVD